MGPFARIATISSGLHKLDSVEWLDEEAETEADILTKRVVAKDC